MMAQDRHVVDEAYAGDIIGVFDPGIFSIGDTVHQERSFQYRRYSYFCSGNILHVCVC